MKLTDKLDYLFQIKDESDRMSYMHSNKDVLDWIVDNASNPGSTDTGYEQKMIDLMDHANDTVMSAVIEQVPIMKGTTIVEIGVGGGQAFLQIAEKLGNAGGGKLIALDISRKCLETAKELVEKSNWSEKNVNIQFVEGGIGMDTPPEVNADSIDAIYHSNCWYFWPELRKGAHQCFLLLKKDGVMISGSKTAMLEKLIGKHNGAYSEIFKHTEVSLLEEAMKSAGFSQIQTEVGGQDIPHTVTIGKKQ